MLPFEEERDKSCQRWMNNPQKQGEDGLSIVLTSLIVIRAKADYNRHDEADKDYTLP